jgi:hypothetical protein
MKYKVAEIYIKLGEKKLQIARVHEKMVET